MNKEETLKRLRGLVSNELSFDLLTSLLSSSDKDIKHEAWNYVLKNIDKLKKEEIYLLLSFPDTGTRYRVWNAIPDLVQKGVLTRDEVLSHISYFKDMLKDNNMTVRFLTWFVTLRMILDMRLIDESEIKTYKDYLCELLNYTDFKD
ncbi:hypothetical protein DJ523_08540, partial [Sulfolobus sp. E5]